MRITTQGPADLLGAAALPVPSKDARAFQSRAIVYGQPGTQAIPAPRPGGVPQDWSIRTRNSSSAPPVWYPSVYYEKPPLEHAPVSVLSDNQLPVPALTATGRPFIASVRPTFLGQTQVGQPKVSPAFPWLGS